MKQIHKVCETKFEYLYKKQISIGKGQYTDKSNKKHSKITIYKLCTHETKIHVKN